MIVIGQCTCTDTVPFVHVHVFGVSKTSTNWLVFDIKSTACASPGLFPCMLSPTSPGLFPCMLSRITCTVCLPLTDSTCTVHALLVARMHMWNH